MKSRCGRSSLTENHFHNELASDRQAELILEFCG
jgi:hypothetical protein